MASAYPTNLPPTPVRTPSPLAAGASLLPAPLPQAITPPALYLPTSPAALDPALESAASPSASARKVAKKMFICQGYGNCTMAFSRSEHLARHIRKHTGERPFKCHCGRDFSRLDNLRQHAQTVHADQQEANQAMMARLQAVHNTLSAQTSSKKRKAASTTPPGQRHQPLPPTHHNSLPLLPPAPINLANFASHQGSSQPNYVASPRQHPSLAEPYFSYEGYHHPGSPYLNQQAYGLYPGQMEGSPDGRSPHPSMAAMVPRQMPQTPVTTAGYLPSSIATTSAIFARPSTPVFHPTSPVSAAARPPLPYASPSPFQASVLQPFSPAQQELYSAETTGPPMTHSPALSYVHTPGPPSHASPALHYTHTPLVYSHSFDGASDDGRPGPDLTHSVDGASSSRYPSPSTPSPNSLQHSAAIKGLGDLVPPEFYASHPSIAPADLAAPNMHYVPPGAGQRAHDAAPYFSSPAPPRGTPSPRGHHYSHSVPPAMTYGGYPSPMSPVPARASKRARDDTDELLQYPDARHKRPALSST